jgi:tetratricopeptide (TPR) repeat protein
MRNWLTGSTVALLLMAIVPPALASDQIIEIRGGSASLQRNGFRHPRPAAVGDELRIGDLVYPFNRARVTVLCQNGNSQERSRLFGLADVCPHSHGSGSQQGRGENDFQAFLDGNFNYASQISEGNPILRWNPVQGAVSYHLQVWECGQAVFNCTSMIWEDNATTTEVRYGGEALQPEHNYQLVAIAIDDQGQEQTAFLNLRRLDEARTRAVQAAVTAANQLPLNAEPQAIARVRSYLSVADPNTLPPEGSGLVLEAIATLEPVTLNSSTPYVHQLLGDLYLQIGLLNAAQSAYNTTLSLTASMSDAASRAAAQVGLANIAAVQGDRLAAERYLRQAKISYALLQEGDHLAQVEEWLDILQATTY